MTPDELPAGKELDALIAEKVFGFTYDRCDTRPPFRDYWVKGSIWFWNVDLPNYSTDIRDAWRIVEESLGWGCNLEQGAHGSWQCDIRFDETAYGHGDADTAPLAICRAALKAVEKKPG